MFVFLSKILPIFVYPVGLASILLLVAVLLHKRVKWQRGLMIAAVVILWGGGNRWVAVSLVRSLEWRYLPAETIPHADAIVLLGGCTAPSEYPRQTIELTGEADRVFYSAWLYHHGAAPHILLSGGYIAWMGKHSSPADDMAEVLAALDVPKDVLWLEDKSRNTHENAVFAKRILDEKGIHKIILVTSAIHMPRSVALFEHQGLEVIPAPTDYFVTKSLWDELMSPSWQTIFFNLIPSAGNLGKTTVAIKEYIGLLVYGLRGWL